MQRGCGEDQLKSISYATWQCYLMVIVNPMMLFARLEFMEMKS